MLVSLRVALLGLLASTVTLMRHGLASASGALASMTKDLLGEERMFVDFCESGRERRGVVLRAAALCGSKGDEGSVRGSGDAERLLIADMVDRSTRNVLRPSIDGSRFSARICSM